MTHPSNPTPGQTLAEPGRPKPQNQGSSHTAPDNRQVGIRPEDGSADVIEASDDRFIPTAVPHPGVGSGDILALATDPDMVAKGYKEVPDDDK